MSNILHSQDDRDRPNVLAHVAGNVRRLRGGLALSQGALAKRAGVSRRMIVSVEGGEANVSLSTLDRLAQALGVSFSEIVRPPEAVDNRRIDSLAWRGKSVESHAKLLGTAPAAREAELWIWALGPGERYLAEADAGAWHEMLYVLEGELTVEQETDARQVKAGDFLIFTSERPYSFFNAGPGVSRFVRNVVF